MKNEQDRFVITYPPPNYPVSPLEGRIIMVYKSFRDEIYLRHNESKTSWRQFWFNFAKRLDFFLPEESYGINLFHGSYGERRERIYFQVTEEDWQTLLQMKEKFRLKWNEFIFMGLCCREPELLFARQILSSRRVSRFLKKAIRDFLISQGE